MGLVDRTLLFFGILFDVHSVARTWVYATVIHHGKEETVQAMILNLRVYIYPIDHCHLQQVCSNEDILIVVEPHFTRMQILFLRRPLLE